MKWTKEKPKKEGLFLFWGKRSTEPILYLVSLDGGQLMVFDLPFADNSDVFKLEQQEEKGWWLEVKNPNN